MPTVLVYAETRQGSIRKVASEAVTAARALADAGGGGGEVHAVLVGPPGGGAAAQVLGDHGADVVILLEDPAFDRYNPEASAAFVTERLRGGQYRAALFS